MLQPDQPVFICPHCFRVSLQPIQCQDHPMLACFPGLPGDERRRPLIDRFGNLVSRAPRWYLEALGRILPDG